MNDNTQFECCGKPEGLLNYFERLAAENGREEFLRGAARTREWIGMMTSDTVTQDGFDEYFGRLENIKRPGSGYFDLWIRVKHWAYHRGLAVPNDHPWRVDLDVICCVGNANFESQLTIDTEYRMVARDVGKQMVRVKNDENKLRWYPNKNFQFPEKSSEKPRSNGTQQ